MKTKILLLTQMHKRPAISELFCMSAQRLCENAGEKYDIRIASLVSDAESEEVCRRYDITMIRTTDKPLGLKMNQGMEKALQWDWQYLLQISDDDVADSRLLDYYTPAIEARVHYFGVKEIYFLDLHNWEAMKFRYRFKTNKLVGCGRMFSRECFERTGMRNIVKALKPFKHHGFAINANETRSLPSYQAEYLQAMNKVEIITPVRFSLYNDDQVKGLDGESEMNILFNGYFPEVIKTPKPVFTDIKSSVNIWTFSQYKNLGRKCDPAEAISFWSEKEVKYLKTLR